MLMPDGDANLCFKVAYADFFFFLFLKQLSFKLLLIFKGRRETGPSPPRHLVIRRAVTHSSPALPFHGRRHHTHCFPSTRAKLSKHTANGTQGLVLSPPLARKSKFPNRKPLLKGLNTETLPNPSPVLGDLIFKCQQTRSGRSGVNTQASLSARHPRQVATEGTAFRNPE